MKTFQKIFAATLIFAVLAGSAVVASAQGTQPGYVTVIRIEGQCSYSLGDGKWIPLVPGKYLPQGSQIRTGHNGVMDVILAKEIKLPQAKWSPERISLAPDAPVRGMVTYQPSVEQNIIRLTPNTILAIDKLTTTDTGADTVSDTELDLKQGKIYASVKKLSGASQYTIKIPNGIAGVRGTWFSLDAGGGTAVYESKTGGLVLAMVFTKPDGTQETKTFLVSEGKMLDPTTGQQIPIPENLGAVLYQIFTALKTIYIEQVDFTYEVIFSYDYTHAYVSPVTVPVPR